MKGPVIFLASLGAATGLLALLERGAQGAARLPDEVPAPAEALLKGTDFADAHGEAPFEGAVRRLDGFELRVVEEGYFKLYARLGRLGRHDDQPRLEEVQVAIFDPPVGGRPSLKLTLLAPFVSGDPKELFHAAKTAPRVVTLFGGVEARDAAGRRMAETERLTIDVNRKTLATEVPVLLRLPEQRQAELRAAGLFADLELKSARFAGPVAASVKAAGGTVTLRCSGSARVEERPGGRVVDVLLEGDITIEHPAGRAHCKRVAVELAREENDYAFRQALLTGAVRLEVSPGTAGGLEAIDLPELLLLGDDRIECRRPFTATWRGHLPKRFGVLGERTFAIAASAVTLRLGPGKGGETVDEARFEELRAREAHGAASLDADTLVYQRSGNVVVAEEADVKTPDGRVEAERLRVEAPEEERYVALLEGRKRITYEAAGQGPLLRANGPLRVTAAGPLRLDARGKHVRCGASDAVVAEAADGSRLDARLVDLALDDGRLLSFRAEGDARLAEPARALSIAGERIAFADDAATVAGAPAEVRLGGRVVRAPEVTYRDDRTFGAAGGVEVEAPLADEGAPWRIRCAEASGALDENGKARRIEARGAVEAEGPGGEVVKGDSFAYDAATGEATLLGQPARVRRGDEVALVAPKGLALRIADGRVVEGRSLEAATIEYRPAPGEREATGSAFTRWHVELRGPARFEDDRILVDLGAKLLGYDGERLALVAEGGQAEIRLAAEEGKVRATEIAASRGVRVEGRGARPAVVTSERLSYRAGSGEVRLLGDARVTAEDWPREATFRELVFRLKAEGFELLRASDVAIR
jgi:hypothetical protein